MSATDKSKIRLLYSHVDSTNPNSANRGKIVKCEVNSHWDIKSPKVTRSGYYEIKAADGTVRQAIDVWVE
jgi:hypothetical protein